MDLILAPAPLSMRQLAIAEPQPRAQLLVLHNSKYTT